MVLPLFIGVSIGKSFWFIQINDTVGPTLASMDPLQAQCPEAYDLSEMAGKFSFTEHMHAFWSLIKMTN